MMPLPYVSNGMTGTVQKICGKSEARLFLQKIGFTIGSEICVLYSDGGNVIVQIKGARVALNRDIAGKIMVCSCVAGKEGEENENAS